MSKKMPLMLLLTLIFLLLASDFPRLAGGFLRLAGGFLRLAGGFLRSIGGFLLLAGDFLAVGRQFSFGWPSIFLLLLAIFLLLTMDIDGNPVWLVAKLLTVSFPFSGRKGGAQRHPMSFRCLFLCEAARFALLLVALASRCATTGTSLARPVLVP